ncbi:MAG: ABC transporter ATP-binding protein [Desulfobacterota bacterium]|nr:ABC transporter ATP-binding protein [Thermodesulfobacteriota bacterium]
MLRLQNINTYYGDIHVLKNVSLHVAEGEIVALIGANGAGKTTILNTICGITPAASGSILYGGDDITQLPPDRIVHKGIAQVPEGRQIFPPLTVIDHLQLGAYIRYRTDGKDAIAQDIERMLILFPRLRERQHQYAGTLSGGEQQMLAIARALMSRPRVLLLDEPSMGLAPLVVQDIFTTIARLRDEQRTTVLLVEQNAKAALNCADRGYVVETGKIMLEGTAQELRENHEVQRAYLGRQKRPIWE